MIRVALFILAVGLLAFGAAWLADRPGEIVLTWQGWHVETTVMVAAIGFVVLFTAVWILWALVRLIFAGPSAVSGFFRGRRQVRGFRALSRGMVAAGAGDVRLARHAAREAGKLLRDEPLTLLLDAQAAQLAGDRRAARDAFEAMAERPDTELLGLRGLYIEAERAGDEETARACVERAVARAPGLAWAASALLEFQTRAHDWPAALATVERNAEHRLVDRKSAKRTRAVLLTAQALEIEEADPEQAAALALEAHKLAPELVPAAVIAGRQAASSGNTRQATRIVEKTWRLSPHPDLAEVYTHARPGDSARDRLKRARALHDRMPNNLEGRIAVAIAAIEAREWGQARAALEPLTRNLPTQRVCMLMADIAEGETGDAGAIREWLARAVRAPRDPAWTADGYVSDRWAPVSPVSGRLDAFEWKVPVEALAVDVGHEPAGPASSPPLIESAPPQTPPSAAPSPEAKAAASVAASAASPAGEPASGTRASATSAPPAAGRVGEPVSPAPATAAGADGDEVLPAGGTPETLAYPLRHSPAPAAGGAAVGTAGGSAEPGAAAEGPVPAGSEAAARPAETPAAPMPEDAAPTGPASAVQPDQPPPPAEPAADDTADTEAEEEAHPPVLGLDRPPDDPGPLPDDEAGAPPRRRFGLF